MITDCGAFRAGWRQRTHGRAWGVPRAQGGRARVGKDEAAARAMGVPRAQGGRRSLRPRPSDVSGVPRARGGR